MVLYYMGLESVFGGCPVLVDSNLSLCLNIHFIFSKDYYRPRYCKSEKR